MKNNTFEGIWKFGRKFRAYDGTEDDGREFMGFVEPVNPDCSEDEIRSKAGIVVQEKFRLISEPKEAFPFGKDTRIVCGASEYKLLSINEIYDGEKVSHRECILLKSGKVKNDA